MNSAHRLFLAFYVFTATVAIAQPTERCLSYGPIVVKLEGTLISKTYPGPPEYESIRKGDRPETYWLLALSRPVCVNRDEIDPDIDPAQKNIRRIQLVFLTTKFYDRDQWLLGKRVVAAGTLYGGTTIHHKTRVLLQVQTLAPQPPQGLTHHQAVEMVQCAVRGGWVERKLYDEGKVRFSYVAEREQKNHKHSADGQFIGYVTETKYYPKAK
jgi:hypothetical protein